jgi:hypothetical protein
MENGLKMYEKMRGKKNGKKGNGDGTNAPYRARKFPQDSTSTCRS